jgi:hypothetical protein
MNANASAHQICGLAACLRIYCHVRPSGLSPHERAWCLAGRDRGMTKNTRATAGITQPWCQSQLTGIDLCIRIRCSASSCTWATRAIRHVRVSAEPSDLRVGVLGCWSHGHLSWPSWPGSWSGAADRTQPATSPASLASKRPLRPCGQRRPAAEGASVFPPNRRAAGAAAIR